MFVKPCIIIPSKHVSCAAAISRTPSQLKSKWVIEEFVGKRRTKLLLSQKNIANEQPQKVGHFDLHLTLNGLERTEKYALLAAFLFTWIVPPLVELFSLVLFACNKIESCCIHL